MRDKSNILGLGLTIAVIVLFLIVIIQQVMVANAQGDLKRTNEVVLRSEAYIGWGVLDAASFAIVREA